MVGVEQGAKAFDCGRIKVDYCATPVGDKTKTFENIGWDMVSGHRPHIV